ncbi:MULTISPECIES: ABC transporter substrate-binding protein [unclassified Rhizobium]|uniref:ABC transporter substrate-binding protein n=1 Tax=unclassified Rhizobium TaxID=2613769 RepID=UPI000715D758|nr:MULTISPECIES: extracellular solute-binding protein [unclassified Rhizobium]KQS88736.1 ABC transporter substrate-binding protein [Rhizobium sp. Leaf391]KQT05679.1 ABC transporter substrate-binding protein [Rhizobium sp. Leaf386]KQT91404.1 ABC transporter substrate-binding protein [Rhizobium sp. Leaf453]
MFKQGLWACCVLTTVLAGSHAWADTVRIAEHRQARIDALQAVIPKIKEATGVDVEIVEYPGPDREYVSKLLTELAAGTGPDIFSLPEISQVVDFSTAGYLQDVTAEVQGSEAYGQFYDIAKQLSTSDDGKIYIMPTMLSVQQLYFRKDVLEKAGISTEQPKTWDELMQRAIDAKAKTGQYSLMLPMGVTWGGGPFIEGFRHLLAGSSNPQIATDDGKLDLTSKGIGEVFGFYEQMVKNKLLPVDPLLGPEPWVIPKYQMFPAGELLITSCGSWCLIFDWGPKSKNPIPDVTKVVGTWAVPGKDGGEHVMVSLSHPWAVGASAANPDAAKKVLQAMGSIDLMVSYAANEGNLPARKDAVDNAEFQKLTALVPIMSYLDKGAYLKTAPGFSTVVEGVARATEALLLGNTDAAGAQKILVDYAKSTLGEDQVK